jgi:hypothetical protein
MHDGIYVVLLKNRLNIDGVDGDDRQSSSAGEVRQASQV